MEETQSRQRDLRKPVQLVLASATLVLCLAVGVGVYVRPTIQVEVLSVDEHVADASQVLLKCEPSAQVCALTGSERATHWIEGPEGVDESVMARNLGLVGAGSTRYGTGSCEIESLGTNEAIEINPGGDRFTFKVKKLTRGLGKARVEYYPGTYTAFKAADGGFVCNVVKASDSTYTIEKLASTFGVGRATVYRTLERGRTNP